MEAAVRPRVIVVDDHRDVLDASVGILSAGFDVIGTASNGAAAVASVLNFNPDVVVMDVAMPELDGFQAAAQLRKRGSTSRIVFLSNFAGEDYVLAGMAYGASAFVAKARMQRDLAQAVGHASAGRNWLPHCGVLPRWRTRSGRPHDLQLYDKDAFLVEAVMSFFDNALDSGDSLVVIATEAHRLAFDAAFRARGTDAGELAASGRYTAIDAAMVVEAALAGGTPDPGRFHELFDPILDHAVAASTSAHVTAFGEIAPMLCASGKVDEMIQLERIGEEFTVSKPLSILCAYSLDCLSADRAELMHRVCGAHTAIIPSES